MTVRASDSGIPPLTTSQEAQVRIEVTRNSHAPFFFQSPYSVTIPEMRSVGTVITQVTVSDADTVVSFLFRHILMYAPLTYLNIESICFISFIEI